MKQIFTREYFQRKGKIGGKTPRNRTAAAKLGWIRRKANAEHKQNCNVAGEAK